MTDELNKEIDLLQRQLANTKLPEELQLKTRAMVNRLYRAAQSGFYTQEYESIARYINLIVSLPWYRQTSDQLDLIKAKAVLDTHHYGLTDVKDRILEYLAVLKLHQVSQNQLVNTKDMAINFGQVRAPIICLIGLVGTGKTTLAESIAKAMGRRFVRIPFGGMGSALDLRGQSRSQPDAEPGLVIKALERAGTRNPVILLDEIDRITNEARSDIMGILVELLDPAQNHRFRDHFVDYPFDLSQVFFIATGNNTTHISTAVIDRLEVIQMPSYTDQEKTIIAKNFILPQAMKASGLLSGSIIIDDDVWPKIIRPLGYDAGVRTLSRTIYRVCRKLARLTVEGQRQQFHLTIANIKQYLPQW